MNLFSAFCILVNKFLTLENYAPIEIHTQWMFRSERCSKWALHEKNLNRGKMNVSDKFKRDVIAK